MMILYALGIMVALALVSWVHYWYSGGGWKNAEEPVLADEAWSDGTGNGAGCVPPAFDDAGHDADD